MFISFEGLDGSGKTTVLEKLREYLKKHNIDFVLTREPGSEHLEHTKKIRNFIMESQDISPMMEAILFASDRRYHLEKVIWPALKDKKLVLCDRYFDSSFAYQGEARNLGLEKIIKLNEIITENTYPNLTIYFALPFEESIKRVEKRGNKNRLENETKNFVRKTYEGYQKLIKKYPKRFRVIDATQKAEKVFADVKKIFQQEILKLLTNSA